MKKLLAFLLIYLMVLPPYLLAQSFPPLYTAGVEIPGNGFDDDEDDTTDETIATSIVEDSSAAGNYHFHFKDCEKVVFANVTDSTFPNSTRVEKPAGSALVEGEIACYIPNLPANTYTLHVLYSSPAGARAVWSGINKQMRFNMKAETASFLAATTTPQWQQLVYTGTAENYYKETNGGDQVSFVWPGGAFTLVFRADDARYACGYLSIGATPTRTCPGQSGSGPTADAEIQELGSETVPTSCSSAAFNNANILPFTGSVVGTPATGTVKALWDNAATDRGFVCIRLNDTEAVTVITTNDNTSMPSANEDGIDIRWRGDLSAVFDTNTYMVKGNLQPVYFDADWSGASNARNPAVNLNTTVVRNITASTSWEIFLAFDLGSNITPDTIGLFNIGISDHDAAGGSYRYFKGTGITDINQWGTVKWSSATVPPSGGGGDTTPPTVTSPAISAVQQTSFIMTANTNESGTCKVRYGDSTGNYNNPNSPTLGTGSVNGVCTVSVTGLSPGITYYADMQVCDSSNNCGDSSEQNTTTIAVPGCTHYAGPTATGSGNGSSLANRYLISNFTTSSHSSPGAVLCLADGTYKGSSSMINPTPGKNGNSLAPIIIRAINDGGPWIHGEGVNQSLYLNNNDWWIIEGIDVSDSSGSAVATNNGATNNIIRRVCAWNANPNKNNDVWGIHSANNLIEDVCGFGTGRKTFSSSQGGDYLIVRRSWGMWESHIYTGPRMVYTNTYTSKYTSYENVMGMVDGIATEQAFGIFSADGQSYDDSWEAHTKYMGGIGIVRSSLSNNMPWIAFGTRAADELEFNNMLLYIDPGSNVNTKGINAQIFDKGSGGTNKCGETEDGICDRVMSKITEVGITAADSINTATWTVQKVSYSNVKAMMDAGETPFQTGTSGNGARVCTRYGDPTKPFAPGVLTSTKLWPWPMDSRINAALVRGGKDTDRIFGTGKNFTTYLESVFGTIPTACKS